jgi:hypothetical protein
LSVDKPFFCQDLATLSDEMIQDRVTSISKRKQRDKRTITHSARERDRREISDTSRHRGQGFMHIHVCDVQKVPNNIKEGGDRCEREDKMTYGRHPCTDHKPWALIDY